MRLGGKFVAVLVIAASQMAAAAAWADDDDREGGHGEGSRIAPAPVLGASLLGEIVVGGAVGLFLLRRRASVRG